MHVFDLIKDYGSTVLLLAGLIGTAFNIVRRLERRHFQAELKQNERLSKVEGAIAEKMPDNQSDRISKLEGSVDQLSKMVIELNRKHLNKTQ